jgi:hypothetical protein
MPLFLDKNSLISGKQAQQSHRFVLNVRGVDVAMIRSVSTPKYKVGVTKYDMLEYEFNYPEKVKWEGPVSFEILQIIDESIFTTSIGVFISKLYDSAYYASPMGIGIGKRDAFLPNSIYTAKDKIASVLNNGVNTGYTRTSTEGTVLDFSKQKLSAALGRVEIKTLDTNGKIYDGWRLQGAFITGVTPTDFSYENEKISTVKIDVSYDWADYGFRGVYAEEDTVQRILGI